MSDEPTAQLAHYAALAEQAVLQQRIRALERQLYELAHRPLAHACAMLRQPLAPAETATLLAALAAGHAQWLELAGVAAETSHALALIDDAQDALAERRAA